MADLVTIEAHPNLPLWSSPHLKEVVLKMGPLNLFFSDEDPMEWIKTCFTLIPYCNVLRSVRINLIIIDAPKAKLRRLFESWASFHVLLDGALFKATNVVHIKIHLWEIATLVCEELNFNFAQAFAERPQYKFQDVAFGKSKKLSYKTL